MGDMRLLFLMPRKAQEPHTVKILSGWWYEVACPVALMMAVVALAVWPAACQAQGPTAAKPKVEAPKFPLEFRIVDPDNPANAQKQLGDEKLPPLFVSFPGGKTEAGKDATGPIGRLEAFRGNSKLLPDSNDDPGLPVLLCGLRFLERKNAEGKVEGYDVELQGEFNSVKVPASEEAMLSFLAKKPTIFELESKLQYGIIATHSTTSLEIQWASDKIYILAVEGDFNFREGFRRYRSPTIKKAAPQSRNYLYYGEAGELPTLRIL